MKFDENDIVLADDYDSYRSDLLNIVTSTNKSNSILYYFRMDNNIVKSKIIKIDIASGSSQVLKSNRFENYSDFYNEILYPLIDTFAENNIIRSNDVIPDQYNKNLNTYRLITRYNDLLSISGVDMNDIKKFNDIVEKGLNIKNTNKIMTLSINKKGYIGPILSIILPLLVVILVLLLLYFM